VIGVGGMEVATSVGVEGAVLAGVVGTVSGGTTVAVASAGIADVEVWVSELGTKGPRVPTSTRSEAWLGVSSSWPLPTLD